MAEVDIKAAEAVWREAFADMRIRVHLPVRPHDDRQAEQTCRRLGYFLRSDPRGSWVATHGGEVVGLAQAIRRGRLWVLSLFGVTVEAQGHGIGRELLDRALGYADAGGPAIILSSGDPRAMRRYITAGFSLHPVMAAFGPVSTHGLPIAEGVRDGARADIELAAKVDQQVRGAAREDDLAHLLDDGARMLVVDGRGYAMARGGQPVMLAATDDEAAKSLLVSTLAGGLPEQPVEVGWLSGGQQWAVDIVVAAGLELRPSGAIMLRGLNNPPAPYIANGAFG